ncbi:phosphonate degradation HD-domain oxygenase [Granulicella aggregans]|jgi:phosphonate degradation associated HDIG domain protein|uniref:phosphonate degradation HD-domain oxygenase n=1 Tax=Granulicella aggregans TaxID=474949 RepID=UPI0021E00362|nr:phosphonate degradation HD-domain oxygenase [Granulicella aggregans]
MAADVQLLLDLLETRGNESYFGERVSVLEHSLQAAHFAEKAKAPCAEVAAALLHDIGHLLHHENEDVADRGLDTKHEEIGCEYLRQWFDDSVIEPIRLHVAAKRYLCAIDAAYLAQLSESSVKSLAIQGGPMSELETEAFLTSPFAKAAIRLRRWDDEAKVEDLPTLPLKHYLHHLKTAMPTE